MAPVMYVDAKLQALNITSVDPLHKKPPGLKLGPIDGSTFNHQPVKEFVDLEYNEALIVHRSKERPVVLFPLGNRSPASSGGTVSNSAFLCLPIYGLDQFEQDFSLAVKAFKYVNRFYLPAHPASHFEEGMIRFDRAQVVHQDHLRLRRPPIKLHSDSIFVLQEWFRYYTTGTCEDFLLEHQKIELEKLSRLPKGL